MLRTEEAAAAAADGACGGGGGAQDAEASSAAEVSVERAVRRSQRPRAALRAALICTARMRLRGAAAPAASSRPAHGAAAGRAGQGGQPEGHRGGARTPAAPRPQARRSAREQRAIGMNRQRAVAAAGALAVGGERGSHARSDARQRGLALARSGLTKDGSAEATARGTAAAKARAAIITGCAAGGRAVGLLALGGGAGSANVTGRGALSAACRETTQSPRRLRGGGAGRAPAGREGARDCRAWRALERVRCLDAPGRAAGGGQKKGSAFPSAGRRCTQSLKAARLPRRALPGPAAGPWRGPSS